MSRTDATITDWRRDPWDEPEEIEPEDLEPLPPDRKGGRRLGLAFLAIVVVMFLLAGLGGRWAIQQVSPPGEPGDPVNFTVNEGDTLEAVATRLQDEGIITNARVSCRTSSGRVTSNCNPATSRCGPGTTWATSCGRCAPRPSRPSPT